MHCSETVLIRFHAGNPEYGTVFEYVGPVWNTLLGQMYITCTWDVYMYHDPALEVVGWSDVFRFCQRLVAHM